MNPNTKYALPSIREIKHTLYTFASTVSTTPPYNEYFLVDPVGDVHCFLVKNYRICAVSL